MYYDHLCILMGQVIEAAQYDLDARSGGKVVPDASAIGACERRFSTSRGTAVALPAHASASANKGACARIRYHL